LVYPQEILSCKAFLVGTEIRMVIMVMMGVFLMDGIGAVEDLTGQLLQQMM
jgi:hypothetical protein